MAVINRNLYNQSDVHSYFVGGVAEYEGELHYIEDYSDGTMLLSGVGGVPFNSDMLSFPHPQPGCFQVGDHVEVMTKEPYRQWKKTFRIREAVVNVPMGHLVLGTSEISRVRAMFEDREASYGTAYAAVECGDCLSHILNKSFYLCTSTDGSCIEVFHKSNIDTPIGCASVDHIMLYTGANFFKEALSKIVEVKHEDQ